MEYVMVTTLHQQNILSIRQKDIRTMDSTKVLPMEQENSRWMYQYSALE